MNNTKINSLSHSNELDASANDLHKIITIEYNAVNSKKIFIPQHDFAIIVKIHFSVHDVKHNYT